MATTARIERLWTALEVKQVSEKGDVGTVEGYGAVFGNVDLGMDVIEPGAFKASLDGHRDKGASIPMLWQHDPSDPIGMWTDYSEDDRGLRMKGTVLRDTVRGRDAWAFLKAGAVKGLSIGYRTEDADMDRNSGIRTIRKASLAEVSVVTFPMNPEAGADTVKFCDTVAGMTEREIERHLIRDGSMPPRDAKAAVSRLMALGAERDARAHEAAAEQLAAARATLALIRGG